MIMQLCDFYIFIPQESIRGKNELFLLIIGFVLFVADIVTDVILAVEYERKGNTILLLLTLIFIIVPHICISMMIAHDKDFADDSVSLCVCLLSLFSSLLIPYANEFKNWKRRYRDTAPCESCQGNDKERNCSDCNEYAKAVIESNESAYKLAWYHYVEAIAESAPQWCLQVLIMLFQWDFPSLTVTSAVFSFLSLAYSITKLEKTRVTKEGDDFKIWPHFILYFTCQMFTLLSRLSAIVTCFNPNLIFFGILHIHWMFVDVVYTFHNDSKGCCLIITVLAPYLNILTFPFFIHPTKALYLRLNMGPDGFWYGCFHLLMSAESILMTVLALEFSESIITHMNIMKVFPLTFVIAGLVLGSILRVIYHYWYEKPYEDD